MIADCRALYSAFKSKDPRFDGRFFIAVASTGIYCRPICRAKTPKAENCGFFSTAAEAEKAGYRPCLLCRPELAPGASRMDATATLARRASQALEESCGQGLGMIELAGRLGCSDRHLRRAFAAEFNVTPAQYLQTCRLHLAKSLLADTNLPVIDVAMAAGFGSLRRFNEVFKRKYRLVPAALRRLPAEAEKKRSEITLSMSYRPPYRWERILDFLASRAIPGVEAVKDGAYWRTATARIGERKTAYGWLRVSHRAQDKALDLSIDGALLPALPQVMAKVRDLFDLRCDPEAVYGTLASMNDIRAGLCVPGTRLPGCFDSFEMAARAVLGQQITVKAATTLAGRLAAAFGASIRTGIDGLTRAFPTVENIIALKGPIADRLGPLGITGARAKAILELASALATGSLRLDYSGRPEAEMEKLMGIPGIGAWTAQYIAMRAMGWPDAFLDSDYGVRKALAPRGPKEVAALAEAWRPWRSYATVNLWNSL